MLTTPWGESLEPNSILPEYPRPQMRRDSYVNLNGAWEYAICSGEREPKRYDGTILVPFSPECALSGVRRALRPGETLWYRRELSLPEAFTKPGGRVLIHFGAADQEAVVYLNGRELARHMGGYLPFTADATAALGGRNVLTVRVRDDTDASWHSRGKQQTKRGGIWYTPQSGLWQTVWAERVPDPYIRELVITPSLARGEIELTVVSDADGLCEVTCDALADGARVIDLNRPTVLSVPGARAWSPDDPALCEFTVTMGDDRVQSYFALRDVMVARDEAGVPRVWLNGQTIFMNGLLDQGYWPDGLYTAPSDAAMIYDIQTAKRLGYNMLRKHIKVEPLRWYYHCDRLGMLVWQDMVSGGGQYSKLLISAPLVTGVHLRDHRHALFARDDPEGRDEYLRELDATVRLLYNSPCVVCWVPFNEGWGQFDALEAARRVRALDVTRLIDHASGWHDQGGGDFKSLHVYFKPYRFKPDRRGRAVALTEFGGYNLRVDGHCHSDTDFGYKRLASREALWQAYKRLWEREVLPAIPKGLCAAVYTQLTDVEDELNGVMTYDRRVVKLDTDGVRRLNERATV